MMLTKGLRMMSEEYIKSSHAVYDVKVSYNMGDEVSVQSAGREDSGVTARTDPSGMRGKANNNGIWWDK